MIGIIVTVCTLGICYPWALCKLYWKINHTVVEGRRLRFDGKACSCLEIGLNGGCFDLRHL
ncbi:hypothetical protein [Clostridium sp.]|uniref:hypothetical protein n=1 Tax=Clostridium sp. TaxID=1506 RepID=UPI0039F5E880